MNYQLHYDNLMKTRKLRIPDKNVYYENHHIVMKSMGGTNDKDNLVMLTAREHFLAHWLLWRIYRNKQSAYAFSMMCNPGKTGNRKITSSIGYSEMREAMSKLTPIRKSQKGCDNVMFGKTHSILTKIKMRNTKIGMYDGSKNPRARKLFQYDSSLNLLKEWDCMKDCANLLQISNANIYTRAYKNSNNPKYYLKLKNFIFGLSELTERLPPYKRIQSDETKKKIGKNQPKTKKK